MEMTLQGCGKIWRNWEGAGKEWDWGARCEISKESIKNYDIKKSNRQSSGDPNTENYRQLRNSENFPGQCTPTRYATRNSQP